MVVNAPRGRGSLRSGRPAIKRSGGFPRSTIGGNGAIEFRNPANVNRAPTPPKDPARALAARRVAKRIATRLVFRAFPVIGIGLTLYDAYQMYLEVYKNPASGSWGHVYYDGNGDATHVQGYALGINHPSAGTEEIYYGLVHENDLPPVGVKFAANGDIWWWPKFRTAYHTAGFHKVWGTNGAPFRFAKEGVGIVRPRQAFPLNQPNLERNVMHSTPIGSPGNAQLPRRKVAPGISVGGAGRRKGRRGNDRKDHRKRVGMWLTHLMDWMTEQNEVVEILHELAGTPKELTGLEALYYLREHWDEIDWVEFDNAFRENLVEDGIIGELQSLNTINDQQFHEILGWGSAV